MFKKTQDFLNERRWEEAANSFQKLSMLFSGSSEDGSLRLQELSKRVSELTEDNLELLYSAGLAELDNSKLVPALVKFQKILYYNPGYKDTPDLLKYAAQQFEALTKKTVISQAPDTKQTGLRVYKPEKCFNGYTLFAHRNLRLPGVMQAFLPVYLIDMRGEIVHKWIVQEDTILPRLKPNGNLVYTNGSVLFEVDRESNVLWFYRGRIDHAFSILENGGFLISRNTYFEERPDEKLVIEVVSPQQEVLWRWEAEKHREELEKIAHIEINPTGKWLNINSVEIIPDNPVGRIDGRFRKGNVLACLNAQGTVAIIDFQTKKPVWAWPLGGEKVQAPHAATMLDNGNILIFDNGLNRGWSRVVEVDPRTYSIAWEYRGEPKESFFSSTMSNASRLPNGNTLICEATKNRVFEITPEGEIVWDFISDFNKTEGTELIYYASRYSAEYVKPLLERTRKKEGKQ